MQTEKPVPYFTGLTTPLNALMIVSFMLFNQQIWGDTGLSKYKTLDGRNVERINPGTIKECRQFIERYDGVSGFEIFGNTNYVYQFINDAFPNEIEYDFSKVVIANVDIETECENGFPDIENANERIIAITMIVNDDYHIFGLGEFNVEREDKNVQQYKFDNEEDLLKSFVELCKAPRTPCS